MFILIKKYKEQSNGLISKADGIGKNAVGIRRKKKRKEGTKSDDSFPMRGGSLKHQESKKESSDKLFARRNRVTIARTEGGTI